MAKFEVLHGDVRNVLPGISDDSIQIAVTSPPYFGPRDYPVQPTVWGGTPGCDHEWDSYVRPVVTDGTTSRKVQGKDRDNFHIVPDQIPAVCSKCGAWRSQIGKEPTLDLYVQHLVQIFRELRRVLKPDGTFWLNMGDSFAGSGRGRMGNGEHSPEYGTKQGTNKGTLLLGINKAPVPEGMKRKDLMLVPATVAGALRGDGWYLRSEIFWYKPNGFCESVRDRPTRKTERLYLFSKSARYYWDREAARETGTTQTHRNIQDVWALEEDDLPATGLWVINNESTEIAHYAAFPQELPARCIRIGSRPGDLVLDPFSGTGRTGQAALALGRNFVGIELSEHFVSESRRMLEKVLL